MVQHYIQGQLGEDVVEFKKPSHRLDQVVGFAQLKRFLVDKMIPRLKSKGEAALPGAAVAGPIGSGKTFIFEALAAELDLPVLVLKSIRSQWFGQTDVIFERLATRLGSVGEGRHFCRRSRHAIWIGRSGGTRNRTTADRKNPGHDERYTFAGTGDLVADDRPHSPAFPRHPPTGTRWRLDHPDSWIRVRRIDATLSVGC